jgi:nitrite reductase/ring-hydroxylating ferredoxin subunit
MQPVAGEMEKDQLIVPITAWRNADGSAKDHLVVEHQDLKYPIAMFRTGDSGYSAVLMRCTHNGFTLRATGSRLECAAHGSVFNAQGAVLQGPASQALRRLPVEVRDERLFISLKA